MFNKNIRLIIERNYYTPATNLPRFANPYLKKSDVDALNEIAKNPELLKKINPQLLSQVVQKLNNVTAPAPAPSAPARPTGMGEQMPGLRPAPLTEDLPGLKPEEEEPQADTISEEELTSIVQNEVYRLPENRRDIEGFTRLTAEDFPLLDNDTVTTYVQDVAGRRLNTGQGPDVILGIAGSQWREYIRDGVIDASLFAHFNYIKKTPYFRDRFDAVENAYNRVRELYPNSKIIIGGHSLGTALGQQLLVDHPDDEFLSVNGYNGLRNSAFDDSNDKRFQGYRIGTDIVSGAHDILRDETEKYKVNTKSKAKFKSDQENLKLIAGGVGVAALSKMSTKSWETYNKNKLLRGYTNAMREYQRGTGMPTSGGVPGDEGLVDTGSEVISQRTIPSLVNGNLRPANAAHIEEVFRQQTGLRPNRLGLYRWGNEERTFDELMQRAVQEDSAEFAEEVEAVVAEGSANVLKGGAWAAGYAAAPYVAGKVFLDHQSENFVTDHAQRFIKPLGRPLKDRDFGDNNAAKQSVALGVAYQGFSKGAKSIAKNEALEWVKDKLGTENLSAEAKIRAKRFFNRLSAQGKKSAQRIVDRISGSMQAPENPDDLNIEHLLRPDQDTDVEEQKEEEEVLEEGKEAEEEEEGIHLVIDPDQELASSWNEPWSEAEVDEWVSKSWAEKLEDAGLEMITDISEFAADEEKLASLIPLL